jgi:hypothetical protein
VDVITPVADLVRSCGFDVHQPVSLRSTNNVVVWLSPSLIVAKISKEHDRAGRELAVVRELVELMGIDHLARRTGEAGSEPLAGEH